TRIGLKSEASIMSMLLSIIVSVLSLILAYINIFDITREKRDYEKEINMYQDELTQIILDRKKLIGNVEQSETKNEC
ncbi:MAG: hypothetical protein IJQ50_03050, partial [Clostridia bacterium]|nr:hypothetical protein [Clostridia bacterium]